MPDAGAVCIHHVFEAQAARTPDNPALTYEGRHVSYRELNERSNRLANHLRKLGVGPDVLVGVCLERTADLVVVLLAILKSGGAYVPIDPQYPRERRAFMLEDSRCAVMVTQRSLGGELPTPHSRSLLIEEVPQQFSQESAADPGVVMTPDHLAYVSYTSGSTGAPKGALISHHNVVRLFSATQPWFGFTADDVWTLFHSCAFDFSVWEIWGALLHGGRLVVVPFGITRTPQSFHELLCEQRVTVLNQTPSAFRQLIRADEEAAARSDLSLRLVIFGGEALDLRTLHPWFSRHGDERPRLVNMYGITETTVHVSYRPLRAQDVGPCSVIGVPIPDLRIHLLDERQQAVPPGEPGEIYVGGAGVARGYLNRPDLTALKFIPDPFVAESGQRLYRSGDLARRLPHGDLEYLGRIDGQVKIRGYRIELGEISANLNAHPDVRESAVIVAEATPGDKILVAYIVARGGVTVEVADLRRRLRERLPDYMVPASFVFLDRLPMTVNGKLDIAALPTPARPPPDTPLPYASAADESGLEGTIERIWCEVLGVPAVDREQNFFDVGGTSIHLAEVHSRLQVALARRFAITELFSFSTIRGLAAHFRGDATGDGTQSAAQQRARRQRDALAAQRNSRRERR